MQGFTFSKVLLHLSQLLWYPQIASHSSLAPEENVSLGRFLGYLALFEEIQHKLKSTFLPSKSFALHVAWENSNPVEYESRFKLLWIKEKVYWN